MEDTRTWWHTWILVFKKITSIHEKRAVEMIRYLKEIDYQKKDHPDRKKLQKDTPATTTESAYR